MKAEYFHCFFNSQIDSASIDDNRFLRLPKNFTAIDGRHFIGVATSLGFTGFFSGQRRVSLWSVASFTGL